MVTTVRIDSNLDSILDNLSQTLHKKRGEIIRESISFYAKSLENSKKSRILNVVKKTKKRDFEVYKEYEGIIDEVL